MTIAKLRVYAVALLALVSLMTSACGKSPTGPDPVVVTPPPVVVVPPVLQPPNPGSSGYPVRIFEFFVKNPENGSILPRLPQNGAPARVDRIEVEAKYDFGVWPFDSARLWVCLTDTEGLFIPTSCSMSPLTKSTGWYTQFPAMYDLPELREVSETNHVVVYVVDGKVDLYTLPRIGRDGGPQHAYVSEASIENSILGRDQLERKYGWK